MDAIRRWFGPVGFREAVAERPLPSYWRLAVAAIGIGVAGCGQLVITSERVFDYPVLTPLADTLFDIHDYPTAILLGVLLLAVGSALFAGAVVPGRETDDLLEGARTQIRGFAADAGSRWIFGGLLGAGLALSALLWLLLLLGHYAAVYPLLWAGGIAIVAGAFLYLDRRGGVDLRPRVRLTEIGFLVAATGAFIALNTWDLTDWYYSVIGDEYRIFREIKPIADGDFQNFFSLRGAYGILPVAESYYRVAVMEVFGVNYFGWHFASVLAGAAILPPLYFLVRNRFGIAAAVGAVVLLGTAHVQLAYAHTGYSSLFLLFPTVLAFALFFSGLKRESAFLMFAAGVSAGLGFYVLYNARILLPMLALILLVYPGRMNLKRNLPLLLLGFVVTVIPMVIVANSDLITFARDQSLFNYDPGIVPDPWARIVENIQRNLVAFNYNAKEQHFISGGLLEPATAVLAVVGLGYALRRFTKPTFFALLVWFGVAMATSAIAAPHPFVPVIRMSYLLPIMVVLAAVALAVLYGMVRDVAERFTGSRILGTAVPAAALAIVLAGVVGSNVYRFWHVTPENAPSATEAVVMRAVLSGECRDSDEQTVIVAENGTLPLAITAWDWGGDRAPVLLSYDELDRVRQYTPVSCVVYWPTGAEQTEADIARLQQLTGAGVRAQVFDQTGERSVTVLR